MRLLFWGENMIKLNRIKGLDYTKLLTYQEISDYLLDTNCQTHELGLSSNGDMVYGLSVGDLTKPMIFIDGTMHGGHEWRCTHWVKEFIERINNPLNDVNKQLIKEIKTRFCIMVIPCLNTYGYLNNTYTNANGVNLNRNFPVGWDAYPMYEAGHSQCKGTAPFSEPESQIIKYIIDTYRVVGYVNCHTWGGFYGGIFERSSTTKSFWTILDDMKKSLHLSIPECEITITSHQSATVPWVTEWVGSQDSKCGKNVLALIFESGSLETDYMKAELGMTGLFVYSYYCYKWFKTREVILD